MSSRTATRDRLLDTAAGLFYSEGITATGVDRVVACAGVSKPTLYAHFHSKDDLVAAVLDRRHQQRAESLDAWIRGHADNPRGRLLAVFDWLAEWHATEGSRGCAFINAVAELVDEAHPAREVARRQKRWMRDYLSDLAAEAGISDPARAGADLLLLLDGANARMLVNGDAGAASQARRMAETLLDAAGGAV